MRRADTDQLPSVATPPISPICVPRCYRHAPVAVQIEYLFVEGQGERVGLVRRGVRWATAFGCWRARLPAAKIAGSRAAGSRTPCGPCCAAGPGPVLAPRARSRGVAAGRESAA